MPKLNPVSAKKMMKILRLLGFELVRIKGSHHFFFHPLTKKTATVPVHSSEVLGIGLIKEILREVELSMEEYERLRLRV